MRLRLLSLAFAAAVIIISLAHSGLPPARRVSAGSGSPAGQAASVATPSPESPQTKGQPLSTRVVAYVIDAKLDPTKKTVDASEILTYRNLTGQPLQEFPFHLYLNAFQPKSTFMRETKLGNPNFEWKPEKFGAIRVKSLEVPGMGDLTAQIQFSQPDDANPDDHTVFLVRLPRPVAPAAEVQFKLSFEDQLPRVVARTGYLRDFFMIGQWFPKVGVWWKGGWNCHQFHRNTEFFSDFGTFDVKVTVPQNYVLGAAGDQVWSANNSDGTKTVTYHSEDVHDFSWTASPSFRLIEDSWTGSAGTVKIHLLMSPGHDATAPRYLQVAKGTLHLFDEWYGPYPYDRLTIVDPPHGGLNAGGMEYPTLITADTAWWMPNGVLFPEVAVEHEFGHQYWYGMVATNEFEEAWLDEGINAYTEAKVLAELYGKDTSFLHFGNTTMSDADWLRDEYIDIVDYDPLTRVAWKFVNGNSYGGITYGKTATVLLTLEKVVGEDTMRRALRTYFMRYRFTHPTAEDFLRTIEEVSGQNLRWYFDQAVYGTAILDYAVEDVRSERADWYEKTRSSEKAGETLYRSSVVVHRKDDFVFPVELEVKFDNGETAREHWDGRDRWIRYSYVKKARIVSAEIDPGHQIRLDRNLFNNSFVVQEDKRAVRKLTNYWTFVSEWLSQLLAWLT